MLQISWLSRWELALWLGPLLRVGVSCSSPRGLVLLLSKADCSSAVAMHQALVTLACWEEPSFAAATLWVSTVSATSQGISTWWIRIAVRFSDDDYFSGVTKYVANISSFKFLIVILWGKCNHCHHFTDEETEHKYFTWDPTVGTEIKTQFCLTLEFKLLIMMLSRELYLEGNF